jgi:pyruvate dehydrogenase E1 component beta subunit
MAEITMVGAINLALARALAEDETVLVFGQDVAVNGGVFRATDGLLSRFGPSRVFDTPLAEVAIAGMAIGVAAQGFRPVAEIQFSGFIYSTIDQMINHAGRLRTRTCGRLTCPMVMRAPSGGGVHAPEHHSEATEALFTPIPGLKVVQPSSPARAYGLLLAAIRDPDPVIFLEPTRLYRAAKEEVADDGAELPLGQSVTLRDGNDLTLVTWGGMVPDVLAAADAMAAEGIDATVIDVATLKPLDMAPILASVERTGRCIIVQEAALTSGFGAEIAARLIERGLFSLLAPVQRVAAWDVVVPLPRLEHAYLPDQRRILSAARQALEYR